MSQEEQSLDLIILKSIISNKNSALEFISQSADVKLFHTDYWQFTGYLIQYIKMFKDVPTLNILKERHSTSSIYIDSIWNKAMSSSDIDPKEFKFNMEKLKGRFAQGQLLSLRDSIDPEKINISKSLIEVKKTLSSINALTNKSNIQNRTAKENLSIFTENFTAKRKDPNFDVGLPTHYKYLDWCLGGGLKKSASDLMVIAGESSAGKSVLMGSMAVQMWLGSSEPQKFINEFDTDKFYKGANILFFSLEMPYENCFARFLAKLSGLNYRKIETATLNKDEIKILKKTMDFIHKFPYQFHIVDIPYTAKVSDLEAILDDAKNKYDPNCVVIDYLQLMDTNNASSDSDWLKQGIITMEIRNMLRSHQLVGISGVQLNRKAQNAKDSADIVGLHRLARSASIATHCSVVLQILSKAHEELQAYSEMFLIKNRNGPKGKFTLIKDFASSSFIDNPPDLIEEDQNDLDDDISEELDDLDNSD